MYDRKFVVCAFWLLLNYRCIEMKKKIGIKRWGDINKDTEEPPDKLPSTDIKVGNTLDSIISFTAQYRCAIEH